jgi:hypothetical protein
MSAKTLYERFRGAVARRFVRTGIRYGSRWLTRQCELNILIPNDLAIIGHFLAVEYQCVRDGKLKKARHVFAPGSRPAFAVGDGRGQIFLLGTSFKFTDRGIVDFDTQGRAVDYNEKTGQLKRLNAD